MQASATVETSLWRGATFKSSLDAAHFLAQEGGGGLLCAKSRKLYNVICMRFSPFFDRPSAVQLSENLYEILVFLQNRTHSGLNLVLTSRLSAELRVKLLQQPHRGSVGTTNW